MKTDIIIIGAGPAGLTAGIYAKRAGANVLIIEKYSVGGQAALTATIENYPGFESISGFELGMKMHEHATRLGCETIYEDVVGIDASGKTKKVKTTSGEHEAKAIIIASGATARRLNLEGETKLIGRGISYCAVCDGAFFKGKTVAVVGGGNTALEDSMYLAKFAKKVFLIHRRDEFRGDEILAKELRSKTQENGGIIEILYNTTVEKLIGENKLEKIQIKNTKTGELSEIELDGLFVAIGRAPDTQSVNGQVEVDEQGYIKVDENCKTNIDGVFGAGDVTNNKLKQVVTACAQGAIAGNSASRFISLEK